MIFGGNPVVSQFEFDENVCQQCEKVENLNMTLSNIFKSIEASAIGTESENDMKGSRYFNMKEGDWYRLVKSYVEPRIKIYDLLPDQSFQWKVAEDIG